MVLPPLRQRTLEVYREAIVLSMETTILLGGALLFYTLLLILQQIYSYTGVILLSIGMVIILTLDHSSNSSLPIIIARKLMEIGNQLSYIVVCIANKLCEKPEPVRNDPGTEMRRSRIVAMCTSYVAYIGLLVQLFLRYPISLDTFFAGGLIAIAISANHTFLFSYMFSSMERKNPGKNLQEIDSKNEIDEHQLKELQAKYDEDRQRWEQEKKVLTEQLLKARGEALQPTEKANAYSMFGNIDWD